MSNSDNGTRDTRNTRDKETKVGTAARDRERARQWRADAEFVNETNHALDEFDDSEDRTSHVTTENFYLVNGQITQEAPGSRRGTPSLRALPHRVATFLGLFPRAWRPWLLLGGSVALLIALWKTGMLHVVVSLLFPIPIPIPIQ